MARPRAHLNHAPIAEALIDFRVLRRDTVAADQFSDLNTQVGAVYAHRAPMHSLSARFGIAQGQPVEPSQIQSNIGWLYQSKQTAAIAQFRLDGFTFNKLEPYSTWEEVFGEANRLWRIYVHIAEPLEISRVAVRYINRLRLPGPADLAQYLEAPPELPPPIPQGIREFLTRIVVAAPNDEFAVLVVALEASLDPAIVPILLDIDAFRNVSLPPLDASAHDIFQQLRRLKNDIFFATITDHTAEMYE